MKKIIIVIGILMLSTNVFASMGMLKGNWTDGGNRYCKYTNGAIITVKTYELCPSTVND